MLYVLLNHEYCPGVYVCVSSLVLFPYPVLEVSPSHPIEGHSTTLTCKTQLLAQRPDSQFRICFFSDSKFLGSGCSSSPKLQVPAVWRKNPEVYWCMAEETTDKIRKWSLPTKIPVQSKYLSLLFQSQSWVKESRTGCLMCS